MLSNLKVRTGLMLAQLAVAVAALVAIALGWSSMRSNAEAINALDSLSVQQSNLVKDSYVQMLRATIRADIAAAQRAAGDKAGAAENTRIVQQLLTDGKAKLERFKAIPKTTDIGREAEGQLLASFNGFAEGLQAMLGALDRGDNAEYLKLKNTKTAAASGAFSKQLTEFANTITAYSEEQVASSRANGAVMTYVYLALVLVILAVSLGAFLFMNRVVLRPLRMVGESFERIAGGDLTTRVDVQSTNEIGVLMAAVKRMQESLARTVATVRRGVDEINVGSREISAGNTDLSSRTEEQAASLEETAASMEELASTVKQNADNARQANQLAASASDVAERGGSAVAEVVNTMQGISASSRKISEIVSVIDGIAFQTNILALNAAVEAARAGEQGKGFAVVAGEVRSLAQRSAQAAKEIKGLIEDSVSKVGAGSQQVERAGATMQEIVASVKRVTDIMGEISAASEEQSSGIDQVNRAVSQMDEVTQQNAALVEEAAAAAGSLQEQAQRLAEAVAVFKINAGDVIEVPARQLAQHRSAPRVAAPQAETVAPTPAPAPTAAAPAARQAAPAARLTHSAPRAKTATAEAASAARPPRRPAPRAAANDAKPAPAATRRQAPADDDWESF
ncbi:methyl-accepting chemotaxis protein [Achromobacter xylosoxidans]|uniref:methyl-accepting chemotaxis protein n=2 Tax=Alcaligenes xylosoxydans xylosoxydans TaxID=85698 RepID=UPI0005D85067|nr:methyl-accepting chemotaxis protein [Achromobacter xylosoxidans]QEQ23013.1 HAMP domain-containing protein [Achromobacter xylosoxidans]QKQ57089.1 Tar ligand binding domain-containing protein [Achromobacter xylosoxidans]QPR93757.1 Tar ligand binding domain-containing protein [Achromobacter xylosoxidans]UON43434.1 Tar ligand binding domain-containing protein [Achromobacter xylosoxidans]CKH30466.1 Serine chemoreceptor protein [Achromobacter xylosoxidans]